MTPEPRAIFEIREHANHLAAAQARGATAVGHDRGEAELLAAWDAQAEALAVLGRQLAEKDEALDALQTETAGQAVDDALAYVEMRQDVLGVEDPLAVLAATVETVRRVFNSNAREALRAEPAKEEA